MSTPENAIVPVSVTPEETEKPAAGVVVVPPAVETEGEGPNPTPEPTPEQRLALARACAPLVRTLRRRVRTYSLLWSVAGVVTALLAIPALVTGHAYWALTAVLYGGALFFFSAIRIAESRSLAALTEVGRSGLRRKVWLGFNTVIFVLALVFFVLAFIKPDAFPVWTAMPCAIFAMVVAASPVWEWFFVHRTIAASKGLVDDFCRAVRPLYGTPEESPVVPLLLDALADLEALREKGALKEATLAFIQAELLGLPAPTPTVATTKPW